MSLLKIASRIAAGAQSFLVTLDEPQGICLGFRPPKAALQELMWSRLIPAVEQVVVVSDDGTTSTLENVNDESAAKVVSDPDGGLHIQAQLPTQEQKAQGMFLLGPDLYVWRSEAEFAKWAQDTSGSAEGGLKDQLALQELQDTDN